MSELITMVVAAVITKIALPADAKWVRTAFIEPSNKVRRALVTRDAPPAIGPDRYRPIAPLKTDFASLSGMRTSTSDIQKYKDWVVVRLSQQLLYTLDEDGLRARVAAFRNAATITETQDAGETLWDFVFNSHHRLFTAVVQTVCERALVNTGFSKIERFRNRHSSDTIRFAATDSDERTLMTGISALKNGDLKIETGVLVSDKNNQRIIDDYIEALLIEGVCFKGTPQRKKMPE